MTFYNSRCLLYSCRNRQQHSSKGDTSKNNSIVPLKQLNSIVRSVRGYERGYSTSLRG